MSDPATRPSGASASGSASASAVATSETETQALITTPIDQGNVPLAHHFDDPRQQHESAVLGMWAFLATEVMFFGGLITAYTVYRALSPEEFAAASQRLSPFLGGLNTLVLLGSSLAVALAVRASTQRKRSTVVAMLLLTMVLGAAFLGIKAYEWSLEFGHHLAPGRGFAFFHDASEAAEHATLDMGRVQMFFVFYFFLTGLHAFHMIIGLVILGIIALEVFRRRLPATGERPVEITGLYWHFVDIVWVFLYPLLYLIEVR